jgi:hypothetical protein
VQGLEFSVQGLEFRVQGLKFRVQGLELMVCDLLSGLGSGFRVIVRVVNQCRSHWRLAKFRGLMCGGKHGAVIGKKRVSFM